MTVTTSCARTYVREEVASVGCVFVARAAPISETAHDCHHSVPNRTDGVVEPPLHDVGSRAVGCGERPGAETEEDQRQHLLVLGVEVPEHEGCDAGDRGRRGREGTENLDDGIVDGAADVRGGEPGDDGQEGQHHHDVDSQIGSTVVLWSDLLAPPAQEQEDGQGCQSSKEPRRQRIESGKFHFWNPLSTRWM